MVQFFNHHSIWSDAQVPQRTFSYYHPESEGLDFAGLMDDIKNAPNGSFFLLHACAHNPTGVDPTREQCREISYQFKVKNHFPLSPMVPVLLLENLLERCSKLFGSSPGFRYIILRFMVLSYFCSINKKWWVEWMSMLARVTI